MPAVRRGKSIYGRVKKFSHARPAPILVHGDRVSTELYGVTERVVNPRISRIKATIETLRLSAAHAGSYSLSANQLGISNSIFVMHRQLLDDTTDEVRDKIWLHPEAFAVQEQIPALQEADEQSFGVSNR